MFIVTKLWTDAGGVMKVMAEPRGLRNGGVAETAWWQLC